MLRHGLVYWDDCGVVWILHNTWCSQEGGKNGVLEVVWLLC